MCPGEYNKEIQVLGKIPTGLRVGLGGTYTFEKRSVLGVTGGLGR